MGIMAKNSGEKTFTPVPEGLHKAVCWAVVDLGIQRKQGKFPGEQHQVYLGFETPGLDIEYTRDGVTTVGPMRIGTTLALSLSERAHLRRHLEKWRGRPFTEEELTGFDVSKLVGAPCQIVVGHVEKGGKVYANIDSFLRWPKGEPAPAPTETLLVDLSLGRALPENLPKWLGERLEERLADNWEEFNARQAKRGPSPSRAAHEDSNGGGDFDDDIPF